MHGVFACENSACRKHRNIEMIIFEPLHHIAHDVFKVVFGPIVSKTQMASCKRPLNHDVVRQAVHSLSSFHEDLQRTRTGDNNTDQSFAETRIVLHELHTRQMQTGRKGNTVNTAVQSRI